jgi:hypothetical protein
MWPSNYKRCPYGRLFSKPSCFNAYKAIIMYMFFILYVCKLGPLSCSAVYVDVYHYRTQTLSMKHYLYVNNYKHGEL